MRFTLPAVIIIVFLTFSIVAEAQTTFPVSGTITNAATKEAIPRASVAVLGSNRGAIANKEGRYSLSLLVGTTARLRITAVGFEPDTVTVTINGASAKNISLRPTPITSDVVVVTSDASRVEARRIMREVIRRKKLWRDKLADYKCSAYSRWNIRSISGGDTVVRSVVESTADGYWRKDKGFFARITGRTQTANFPSEANLFSIGPIMNFYDNRVDIATYTITSPVADDAFDVYDYDLIGTGKMNGSPVYKIILDPSVIAPGFDGVLWIDQNDYTIAYLDLTPSKAVKLGPLKELRMQQTFDLFRDTFWMPIDLRTSLAIKLGLPIVPEFTIELLSDIKGYAINSNPPDSFFVGKNRIALPDADSTDPKQWAATRAIPLAHDEEKAYIRLDSVNAEGKHDSNGKFSILSLLPFPDLPVYNQIEGLRLGVNKSITPSESFPLTFGGSLAYGLKDKVWKYTLSMRQGLIWKMKKSPVVSYDVSGDFGILYKDVPDVLLSLDASYFSDLQDRGLAYSGIENSITSLIYKQDYPETYRHQGFKVGLDFDAVDGLNVTTSYTSKKIWTADSTFKLANDSLPYAKKQYNAISLGVDARTNVGSWRLHFLANINATSKALASDASFTTGSFELTASERLGGWGSAELIARYAMTFAGALPRWNLMYFETRNKFFSKFGYFRGLAPFEFMGDRIWSMHLEHNFYDLPTRLLGLHFMDGLNLHWRFHGGIGEADIIRSGTAQYATTVGKPYGEIGFGIGNIFNLITLEATWRLAHKGSSNFYPTAAVQLTF